MSANPSLGPDSFPTAIGEQIDQVCDRFEAAWRVGHRPKIEEYLGKTAGQERLALLRELLLAELEWRRSGGERPTLQDYRARFPADTALITELFEATRPVERRCGPRAQTGAAPTGSDRNLLFGILAVQMDFVTGEALIAAMNAWVLEKAKPLGRILLDQHALTEDEHQLLEALVARHVQKHGGDSGRSLAAIGPVRAVREQLAAITDPELQSSLASLAMADVPDDPDTTWLPSEGARSAPQRRYRILWPHARGGLGQVFVALDEELNRKVAVKEMQLLPTQDPDGRNRFLREAEITGNLEHPGVVPIYGLGANADGRPYYAMRFIKGDSLQQAIARFHEAEAAGRDPDEQALAFRRLLARFVAVCNAIAYAHCRGVLHRDLKPANIMLGPFGETLVVDWGLAKVVGRSEGSAGAEETLQVPSSGKSTETLPGSPLGTPAYMSPEQAAGRHDELGPASDIYSLGATLYCLLTGRPPFAGQMLGAVLLGVQRGEFPPPRQAHPKVPPALEAICLRAMTIEPTNRYASPRDLADDLERWLADEPVSVYREGWGPRLARWARRHKPWVVGVASLLGAAVVALTIGTLLIEAARRDEALAHREAEGARRAEVTARRQAEDQLYLSNVALASREWQTGNLARVEELLNECASDRRHWEWHYLKRQTQPGLLTLVGPHVGQVTAVAFSPDGARLVSAGWHGTVTVWDAAEGRVVLDLSGHAGHVLGAAYSPDGRWIATAGEDQTVRLWDAVTGEPGPILRGHTGAVTAVTFSPDSRRLASGGRDRVVKIWDPATGEEMMTLRGHTAAVTAVVFSPDGQRLATAGELPDMAPRLWDLGTGEVIRSFPGHVVNVNGLAFRPDGRHLASASNDGLVLVWDVESGQARAALIPERRRMVKAVAYSPDGKFLASGGVDQAVRIWDTTTNREILTLRGSSTGVTSLAFRPDGRRLASASEDGVVILWDPAQGPESVRIPAEAEIQQTGLAFSPDNRWVASASQDYPAARVLGTPPHEKTIRLWDAVTGAPGPILRGHEEDVEDLAFAPDGTRLAAAGIEGTVSVWEVPSGRRLPTLRRSKGKTTGPNEGSRLVFGPDAASLAVADPDRTVTVWEIATGREVRSFHTPRPPHLDPTGLVRPVQAFSPDGRRLAVGELDGIHLWDLAAGNELTTFRGGLATIFAIAFSPDGSRLAAAAVKETSIAAGEIQIWDLAAGREVVTFSGAAGGGTTSLAFTPDGKRLASTGTYHRDVQLWDTGSGRELLALRIDDPTNLGGPGPQSRLAFGPDGTRLALVGFNGVTLWEATPGPEALTLHTPVEIMGLAYDPAGTRLAIADNQDAVSIRAAATGRVLLTLPEPDLFRGAALRDVQFSPDGRRLALSICTVSSGWVTLGDATTGRIEERLKGHSGPIINVAFSPDGTRLATSSHDKTARVWEIATGRTILTLGPQADRVNGVAFSPDGTQLATACRDGTLTLWNAATGRKLTIWPGHQGSLACLAFSPDGQYLATAGGRRSDQTEGPPGEVKVWETATGRAVLDLPNQTHFVYSVAISPDGRFLASGGEDRVVRVWDLTTGQEQFSFHGHQNAIMRLAFHPDGRSLASCSLDRTVRVWDLTPHRLPFGQMLIPTRPSVSVPEGDVKGGRTE